MTPVADIAIATFRCTANGTVTSYVELGSRLAASGYMPMLLRYWNGDTQVPEADGEAEADVKAEANSAIDYQGMAKTAASYINMATQVANSEYAAKAWSYWNGTTPPAAETDHDTDIVDQ